MRCLTLRRARVALFGFSVFLTGLVVLADAGRGQWLFHLAHWVPGSDKTGHFVLFGLLAFLVNVVMRGSVLRIGRLPLLQGSVVVALVAVAEEVSQLGFVARTFDLRDLGAGLAGIFLLGQLACVFLKRERALAIQAAGSSA
jgi:polysaccharide biosynthesis protein VpsQ